MAYVPSFHWILLVIMLDQSKMYVLDSMRKPPEQYRSMLDLLDRYARYMLYVLFG